MTDDNNSPKVHQVDVSTGVHKKSRNSKRKKKNRSFLNKITTFILPILLYMSIGWLLYSLISSDSLNVNVKIGAVLMVILLTTVFLLLRLLFVRMKFNKKAIGFINILLVILLIIVNVSNYFYIKTFGTLNEITGGNEYIRFILVVPEGSDITSLEMLNGKTIGFQSTGSKEGSILPQEELEKRGITYDVQNYSSYTEALDAMFEFSQVDALILPSLTDPRITDNPTYVDIKGMVTTIESFSVPVVRESSNNSNVYSEPFTIFISGIDTRTGNVTDNAMSDVLMLVTVNPTTKHASLISIPRDSYVPITCQGNQKTKITHSGASGIGCTVDTAANFLGIDIDYYIKIDFDGVLKIVDALGGIDIDVPEAMDGVCEQDSSGYEDTICFTAGLQTLDGQHALALARHRHSLTRGDFDRNYHQQLVLSAMFSKLAYSGPEMITPILNAMPGSVATDLSTEQLVQLMQLAISTKDGASPYSSFGSFHVQRVEITGSDLDIGDGIYYFKPDYFAVKEASNMINDIISATSRPIPDSFTFSIHEQP